MRKKRKAAALPPIPELIHFGGKRYLLVKVPKDADKIIVDNAMGYLIYRIPNYSNWITDDQLEDFGEICRFLDNHNCDNDFINSGCKLPDGKWEVITDMQELLSIPVADNSMPILKLKQVD